MGTRISLEDIEMAWRSVDEATRSGRGALERAALAFDVRRSVVMHAINRVEAAFGGHAFFVAVVRRTGQLTPAGRNFHRKGRGLVRAWKDLASASVP